MGGSSTTLSIILKLVDDASAAMQGVGDKMKSVGESMMREGRLLTTDVTLPIVGIGVAATKMASDFGQAATQLQTEAGYSREAMQGLSQSVLDFAQNGSQYTAFQLMHDGLYHIASLGVPAAQAMDVLKVATEGAAIGVAPLEDVANALGAAVASNIKGADNYHESMAILNATVGAGNMRMQDLAASLGNVLPQATTAGLSLKDVGAAMATMTDNGMPAADAATRLHMAIALMSAPTGKAEKALSSINMTQFQLADDMRNKGLLPALQDLHDHLVASGKTADEQAAVLSAAFGGGRSAGAIELLLNNLDRVGQKYELIGKQVSDFDANYATESQTAAAKFAEAQAAMSAASVNLGAALLPLIETVMPKLVALVTTLVGWFTNLPGPVQTGILVFLGLLAVLGPIIIVIGSAITVVSALITVIGFLGTALTFLTLNPIGLVIIAIGAIVVAGIALYQHWDVVKAKLGELGGWFKSVWADIQSIVKEAVDYVMGLLQPLINAINSVKSAASSIGSSVMNAGSLVMHAIIPHAAGGIVTSPHIGLVGEAGPEAIIPLNQAGGFGLGTNINITITGNSISNSMDLRRIASEVSDEIVRTLRLNQKLAI